MKPQPFIRFLEDIFSNPVDNRRRGMQRRKASLWMRTLALSFLAGIAASVAVLLYDRRLEGDQPAA